MAQIEGSQRVAQYTASEGQTSFSYGFEVYSDVEIIVQQNDTTLELTTDYTVTGTGTDEGGTVELVTGASAGDIITLTGNSLIIRETTFSPGGDFAAEDINAEYDRIDDIMSELVTGEGATLKFAVPQEGVSTNIPTPEAGKAMKWNATGTALQLTEYDPDETQADCATFAKDAAESAEDAAESAGTASPRTGAKGSELNAADSAAAALVSEENAAASAASIDPAAFASDLIPDDDGTRDLGSPTKKWAEGHIAALTTAAIDGVLTINDEAPAPVPKILHLKDLKSQGVHGGTYTAGDWMDRDLNTVILNEIPGASLDVGTGYFTLPPGKYIFQGTVPCYEVNGHIARIRNNTLAENVTGSPAQINTAYYNSAPSYIFGSTTITESCEFRVQGRVETSQTDDGMGRAANLLMKEIYTNLFITKIA